MNSFDVCRESSCIVRRGTERRCTGRKNRSVIIRINTSATLFKCSKPPSFQNKSSKMFLSRSLKLSTERSAGLDTDSSVATIT